VDEGRMGHGVAGREPARGFCVVGHVDAEKRAARGLAAPYPMPYPSFVDPRYNITKGRFGARGLPATAFFDARGRLAIVRQGEFATRAQLAAAIERYALR